MDFSLCFNHLLLIYTVSFGLYTAEMRAEQNPNDKYFTTTKIHRRLVSVFSWLATLHEYSSSAICSLQSLGLAVLAEGEAMIVNDR